MWFVFHDSIWSFHESYFSRKLIFHESYRVERRLWSLNLQISIILFGNVIIIKYIFINNLKYHPFLDRQLTIQTFAYYLIYPGTRKVFCEWKFDLSCSIEIYHFDGLLSCEKQNITQNYFWCKTIQKAFHPHRSVVLVLITVS